MTDAEIEYARAVVRKEYGAAPVITPELCSFVNAVSALRVTWQPIATAPKETELLVGRFVNDEWRICQSGFYFDAGNEREGEPAYWFWHCDWDNGSVTDNEGPTHWMPLPAEPEKVTP